MRSGEYYLTHYAVERTRLQKSPWAQRKFTVEYDKPHDKPHDEPHDEPHDLAVYPHCQL